MLRTLCWFAPSRDHNGILACCAVVFCDPKALLEGQSLKGRSAIVTHFLGELQHPSYIQTSPDSTAAKTYIFGNHEDIHEYTYRLCGMFDAPSGLVGAITRDQLDHFRRGERVPDLGRELPAAAASLGRKDPNLAVLAQSRAAAHAGTAAASLPRFVDIRRKVEAEGEAMVPPFEFVAPLGDKIAYVYQLRDSRGPDDEGNAAGIVVSSDGTLTKSEGS